MSTAWVSAAVLAFGLPWLTAATSSEMRAARSAALPSTVRLEVGVRAPLDAERKRNLEREDDRGDEIRGREDEAGAEAHGCSSSADEKRNPTPRTVWM